MKKIFVILLFSLFFQTLTEDLIEDDKTIKDMKSTLWNRLAEGFHLLQGNIIPSNHTVIAFSSLNDNNGYTDIITYVKESNKYTFYKIIYDKEQFTFTFDKSKDELFTIENEDISSVRNLFVGKLYVGGGVDICYLISFNKKNSDNELIHYIKCKTGENPQKMLINSNILILNRNYEGEGRILFSDNNILKMCVLNNNDQICNTNNIKKFDVDDYNNITISLNGGMAYVDVDGNCNPDIILSYEEGDTRYINIYLSSRSTEYKYTFAQKIKVGNKEEFGPFIISKINNTKSDKYAPYFDILVPKIGDTKIKVFKNKIVKEYKWDKFFCNEDEGNADATKIDVFDVNETFFDVESYGKNAKFDKSLTPMITPGDFSAEDQQGLLVRQKSGDKIFISLFSKDAVKFNLQLNLTKNTKIGNLKSAVFYDINEAGALGLIVQNDKLDNFLIYNFRRDKYFIKSKLMNDRKSYYDMNIGASFRFIVTSKDGSRHMDISYQLAQTSDMNIPLPYSLMGLGETNNYVENFQILSGNYYILPKDKFHKEKYRNFRDHTPVIPNTQMALFKFKNDESKIEWYIDLYVLPTDTLLVIALSIVGFMLVILGIIIYLHVREVKEEQKETNKFKSWFA